MGILGSQKAKFMVAPPKVRVEKVAVAPPKPKPKPKPSATASGDRLRASSGTPRLSPSSARASASPAPTSASSSSRANGQASRKRKSRSAEAPRKSPASDRVMFSSDGSDEEDEDPFNQRKKQRTEDTERIIDPGRRLVSSRLRAAPPEGDEPDFVHAKDLASLSLGCKPLTGLSEDQVGVELQYPGLRRRERYELVEGRDKIDSVDDIFAVVKHISDFYLTKEQARPILDPAGLLRKLERANNLKRFEDFKAALGEFNDRILSLQREGAIARNIGKLRAIPFELSQFILQQVYDRAVSPKVDSLKKYQNGSDNVYGELQHPFIYDVLVEKTRMTSDQVFVDLGSGVANVVLQAALDIGCESWGCEMMENACNLAEKQQSEFQARCQLWGMKPEKVYLERGDFMENGPIREVMKRADVILVNNHVFTTGTNDQLVRMFLDVKPGCKIVSLKSFVHEQKNAANDVASSILDVEHHTFAGGWVSWSGTGGTFFISTRR